MNETALAVSADHIDAGAHFDTALSELRANDSLVQEGAGLNCLVAASMYWSFLADFEINVGLSSDLPMSKHQLMLSFPCWRNATHYFRRATDMANPGASVPTHHC
jgi:hypothetical protein